MGVGVGAVARGERGMSNHPLRMRGRARGSKRAGVKRGGRCEDEKESKRVVGGTGEGIRKLFRTCPIASPEIPVSLG